MSSVKTTRSGDAQRSTSSTPRMWFSTIPARVPTRPRRDRSHRRLYQGDSSRIYLSANCRARGGWRRRAGPMGIGPPWRCAGIRRNGFHRHPGRPDRRHLSLLRQAVLSQALCIDPSGGTGLAAGQDGFEAVWPACSSRIGSLG